MVDVVDPATRSRMMSGIRGKNTKPELLVRKYLHAQGLRFRLHVKDLPGKPDIVFAKYRSVVFVHGCFWHHHTGCKYATMPSSRVDFWINKFSGNVARDQYQSAALEGLGWRVFVIWECELQGSTKRLESLYSEVIKSINS
ncbi:MAG: DNA mismatch endonuclease Vsr [Rugosibacter sp.]|nr:MAG: DNA mismatch endonuclease Vsr [Rugosibacter sp.]TBR12207.1 MAG: DNA mismatch endonuclease Vsr [Rugosibacter sp.]